MSKICMVAYTNYLTDARPRREAETLVRRGDQVDFLSLQEADRPLTEEVCGVRLMRLPQVRYRGSGLGYLLAYLRFFLAASWRVAQLHRRRHYDIIYVHTMPDLLAFVAWWPKLCGAKVVLNVHDMMPELYMSKFGVDERHWLIRVLQWQERCSAGFADKVICVHEPHRQVLCRRGVDSAKLTVLPNVPDPRIFAGQRRVAADDATFRLVYHGTITRRLGLDLAVEAFARASVHCPEARLEIFGDGDAADDLQRTIAASPAAERIQFARRMFRVEEIASMVAGASAGLVPNRRDLATEYMLPVKLLEYVYLGIPVVAPRLKTILYYFEESQLCLFAPGDVDSMAEALVRLYRDRPLCRQLANHAADALRELSWETLQKRLFRVVDDWPGRVRSSRSSVATANHEASSCR